MVSTLFQPAIASGACGWPGISSMMKRAKDGVDQADRTGHIDRRHVRAPRAVRGVQFAGAEEIARQVGAEVHAQQSRQPDREEAAPFGQVCLVGAIFPAQDRRGFRVVQQIVVGAHHQFVAAAEERLHRGEHGADFGIVERDKATHALPLLFRQRVQPADLPGLRLAIVVETGKRIHDTPHFHTIDRGCSGFTRILFLIYPRKSASSAKSAV
ncbi:MAG: hypothetical protein V9G19_10775 [Tetrasphaera sp.]